MKADKDAYLRLASKLDDAGFDALSMEDKHRRNDPELFLCFKKLKVSSVFLVLSFSCSVISYLSCKGSGC